MFFNLNYSCVGMITKYSNNISANLDLTTRCECIIFKETQKRSYSTNELVQGYETQKTGYSADGIFVQGPA
jgi:hypothetical protein